MISFDVGVAAGLEKTASKKPPWRRPVPKDTGNGPGLSDEWRTRARERAAAAGRPYPNLVDNMWASKMSKTASAGLVPPEAVRAAARRGLEARRRAPASRRGGLTAAEAGAQGIGSGVVRAQTLASGRAVSPETVKRMHAFFNRHRKNRNTPRGRIAWDLWGGDAGARWASAQASKTASMSASSVLSHQLGKDVSRDGLQALLRAGIGAGLGAGATVASGELWRIGLRKKWTKAEKRKSRKDLAVAGALTGAFHGASLPFLLGKQRP